ncbi:DUF2617 family protein [Halobacteria archaeon HArc-gm2]|nr:DUF2617 family protein [Halobacteria archaeon HArc-gm2]
MNYDVLCFGHDVPDPDALQVYARGTVPIAGHEFRFRIIGSSHYVRAPSLGFEEIASCEEATVADARTVALDEFGSTAFDYESDAVSCRTEIDVRPIDAFPDASYDLEHAFEPGAVTAIDVGDRSFETWHTYTEHDCAVYTVTEFDRLG